MQVRAVAGDGFEGVTKRVPMVKHGPQPRFLALVLFRRWP
jgi:hypothetical protein